MKIEHFNLEHAAKMDLAEEIQVQIDDQIRMREGAMKLMSASSTLNQALETSKSLLTINARILGLMSALQRKKQERVLQEYNLQRSSSISESPDEACNGRIAISDMRIPLMWRDNVHFTGKTGDQSYYAFALIRCGDQVRDTPLYEITSADTDMYFDLTIIFDELKSDFKMDFEVYYTVITNNEVHSTRPTRPTMNIRSTQKKQVQFKAPKFCLAGHVHITIDDVRSGIISKDLTMGGKGASGVAVLGDLHEFPIHHLELWGQICFQLAAQPDDVKKEKQKGHISIEINSPANLYFCILRQDYLHCWDNEEHVTCSKPLHSIKLTADTKVSQVQSEVVNSVKLLIDDSVVATLTFQSSLDCYEWKTGIRHQINNILSWKLAFEEEMHIEETKKNRLSIPSTASFYDQIKIEEITSAPLKTTTFAGDGIVNEAFNKPSLPSSTLEKDNHESSPHVQNNITDNQQTSIHQNGKSDNCDKTCENTSETAPCSTSVGSMEGSDPVLPALLLQNGHPPPLTRPEESTTHTEDDKETIISTSTDSNQKDDNTGGEAVKTMEKKELDSADSPPPGLVGEVDKMEEDEIAVALQELEDVCKDPIIEKNDVEGEKNIENDKENIKDGQEIVEKDKESVETKEENIENDNQNVEEEQEIIEKDKENVEMDDMKNVECEKPSVENKVTDKQSPTNSTELPKIDRDSEPKTETPESETAELENIENVSENVEINPELVENSQSYDSKAEISEIKPENSEKELEISDNKKQFEIEKVDLESTEQQSENIERQTGNVKSESENNTETDPEESTTKCNDSQHKSLAESENNDPEKSESKQIESVEEAGKDKEAEESGC